MTYEKVAEFLDLDTRDEKRNRMLLGAVTEVICQFLGRNIMQATATEVLETRGCEFIPHEYPVREFLELKDRNLNEPVHLAPGCKVKAISRPDAHCEIFYKIEGTQERTLLVTYNYGYASDEVPQLLQAAVLAMMSDRLITYGKISSVEILSMDKDRLMNIIPYRRLYL